MGSSKPYDLFDSLIFFSCFHSFFPTCSKCKYIPDLCLVLYFVPPVYAILYFVLPVYAVLYFVLPV